MKWLVLLLFSLFIEGAFAMVRLKDIAFLRGVRNNQLIGYGLVVGLNGTGDKRFEATDQSLALLLKGVGIDLKTKNFPSKNAAAVMISATLPPFLRAGSVLDLTISSIGSATSLDGGVLLMSPLRGADGNVYALGQGKVVTVKRSERGGITTGQTMVTGTVPRGGTLEKDVGFDFSSLKELKYNLLNPDFTTASRVARRINQELGGKFAAARDGATVDLLIPYGFQGNAVELVARIENLEVETDRPAKVVMNQRTGTVVLGENVRIAPVAIAHNNLKIEIKKDEATQVAPQIASSAANQPAAPAAPAGEAPAAGGAKQIADANAASKMKSVMLLTQGTSISDVVGNLNEMGATPDDLITLIQMLRAAGAISAEVEMQ